MMKVELYHASKYGNGAQVAEEFRKLMTMRGNSVEVHNIDEAKPKNLPQADLYVFGSPTRIGKPVGGMRHFLKKVNLPSGAKYALFATHVAAKPDKKTGKMPDEEEMAKWQRCIPIMDEALRSKGMVKVTEMKIFVVDMKGPLEEGWQKKVGSFVADILSTSGT
jgi:menaquinone-dependent protoporphyrinogen IX oxidase